MFGKYFAGQTNNPHFETFFNITGTDFVSYGSILILKKYISSNYQQVFALKMTFWNKYLHAYD